MLVLSPFLPHVFKGRFGVARIGSVLFGLVRFSSVLAKRALDGPAANAGLTAGWLARRLCPASGPDGGCSYASSEGQRARGPES